MRIVLPLPPPINQTYKVGIRRLYKSDIAKVWEEEAGVLLLKKLKPIGYDKPITVHIEWYLQYERDIDGGIKILLDLFQRQNIIKNDTLIKKLVVEKLYDNINPRVEVGLSTYLSELDDSSSV